MTEHETSPTCPWVEVPTPVRHRRVDDEVLLLDLRREHYFTLDGVGAAAWQLLAAGATRAEVIDQLRSTFDVDESVLTADLEALVERLAARDLVELRTVEAS